MSKDSPLQSDEMHRETTTNCLVCRQGQTRTGQATVVLQRGETFVIFKDVPADVCENCGEEYFSDRIAGDLLKRAEKAIRNGAEVEILRFAA
ncbi:MAG TPA: type II toxin-antitoxin system MqsA family antitoxin [Thermoanaerobaculia bacterium]|nr:type II toxin-antitoxin system MqsA family antitoxin [Thermoanaerobaculia bacterium]